jgi:hypothetical protein
MARVGAAVACLESAKATCVEAIVLFVSPGDDAKGKERRQAIDDAIEEASIATRCLEDALHYMKTEHVDIEVGEPWEEEDDDEGAS